MEKGKSEEKDRVKGPEKEDQSQSEKAVMIEIDEKVTVVIQDMRREAEIGEVIGVGKESMRGVGRGSMNTDERWTHTGLEKWREAQTGMVD